MNFISAIRNTYLDEENQEILAKMKLNDENITEDFTAMLFALNLFFNKVTGQNVDIIDFTHLLNKLAFQHLMDKE